MQIYRKMIRVFLIMVVIEAPSILAAADRTPELPKQVFWQVGSACGPNALYCMLVAFDRPADYQALLAYLSPPSAGSSMQELAEAAARWKLPVGCFHLDRSRLDQLELPFIAHLDTPGGHHFALVVGRSSDGVRILDPESGDINPVSDLMFKKSWTGYVISTRKHVFDRIFTIIAATESVVVVGLLVMIAGQVRASGGLATINRRRPRRNHP